MNNITKTVSALASLRPSGWSITADDFNSIVYDDGIIPVTKAELDAEIKTVEAKAAAAADATATQKAALLARLGITADEAKLLIG